MRVAVIGAGPSGSSAARVLARNGAAVTLYEKSAWPRAKACGDGLTVSALTELSKAGIDFTPWSQFGRLAIAGPSDYTIRWGAQFYTGTTMRRRTFDALLVDEAVKAGARFEPQTQVISCNQNSVEVSTRSGTVREPCDAILLGEGATGSLATSCGFPRHVERNPAYRGYCSTRQPLESKFLIQYTTDILPGYMWIFPVDSADYANVGAAMIYGGNVRAKLSAWLQTGTLPSRLLRAAGGKLEHASGGIVPIGRARRVINNVFAIGDSAGVADALTGEGISQAMISGRLAAESLLSCNGDIGRSATLYSQSVSYFDAVNQKSMKLRALVRKYTGRFFDLASSPSHSGLVDASSFGNDEAAVQIWRAFASAIELTDSGALR